MSQGDKTQIPSIDSRLKRSRLGNVKDFHGRRRNVEGSFENNPFLQHDYTIEEPLTANLITNNNPLPLTGQPTSPSTASTLPYPQFTQTFGYTNLFLETKVTTASDPSSKFRFDTHMSKWAEEFNKPLVIASKNVEFEMPYCYSEEFYSKASAKGFLMQPFGSIGEPATSAMFNAQLDEWQEKSQLALKYYRQLCEQRGRMPSQTLVIKNSLPLAQYVASLEQSTVIGAEVFFGFQNSQVRINNNVMFDEKDKRMSTMFLVPEQHHNTIKPAAPLCTSTCAQIKYDGSVFTSSWQS